MATTMTVPSVDEALSEDEKTRKARLDAEAKEAEEIAADLAAQAEYEAEVELERQKREDKREKDQEKADKKAEKQEVKKEARYVVIELDKDYSNKLREVTSPKSKSEAEDDCKFLNDHADPLENFKYEVEKVELLV